MPDVMKRFVESTPYGKARNLSAQGVKLVVAWHQRLTLLPKRGVASVDDFCSGWRVFDRDEVEEWTDKPGLAQIWVNFDTGCTVFVYHQR